MALGSTQPLTGVSTRNLPGVKGSRGSRLTTSLPSVNRLSIKCDNLNSSKAYVPRQSAAGRALPKFLNQVLFLRGPDCGVVRCLAISQGGVEWQHFVSTVVTVHVSGDLFFGRVNNSEMLKEHSIL
jgi:hypothetical protein